MVTPQNTQIARRWSVKERWFSIPLPRTDPSANGWFWRYLSDWLFPVSIAAFATYSLAVTLMGAFPWNKKNFDQVEPLQLIVKEGFGITATPIYLYVTIRLGVVVVLSILHKYYGRIGLKFRRRDTKYLHPAGYWFGILSIKVFGIAVTPLIVTLAFARVLGSNALEASVLVYLVCVAGLSAAYFNFLYSDTRPPATLTFTYRADDVKAIEHSWDNLYAWLEDDAIEISRAAGGLWSKQLLLSSDRAHATLTIALRGSLEDLGSKVERRVTNTTNKITKRWRTLGYKARFS